MPHMHYVCTPDEARALVDARSRFWVSNCGCRERGRGCARSRTDVCLVFGEDVVTSGTGRRELTRAEVDALLAYARERGLIPRPFRAPDDASVTDGICFCCDDCCSYFVDDEACDAGAFVERTDRETCTDCEDCVDACHFGARRMDGGALVTDTARCYGCGVCVEACPLDCIGMVPRPASFEARG